MGLVVSSVVGEEEEMMLLLLLLVGLTREARTGREAEAEAARAVRDRSGSI